jgi:hypothetical protein
LYFTLNIVKVIKSRRMRGGGNVAWLGEMKYADKILVENPEEKRPLGKSRHRW